MTAMSLAFIQNFQFILSWSNIFKLNLKNAISLLCTYLEETDATYQNNAS